MSCPAARSLRLRAVSAPIRGAHRARGARREILDKIAPALSFPTISIRWTSDQKRRQQSTIGSEYWRGDAGGTIDRFRNAHTKTTLSYRGKPFSQCIDAGYRSWGERLEPDPSEILLAPPFILKGEENLTSRRAIEWTSRSGWHRVTY